jgi:hypothetical protein
MDANAGRRDAEEVDLEAPEIPERFAEARDVYRQTFGPGAEHRAAVKATLKRAKERRVDAQAALEALPADSPQREAAQEALASARRQENEAHNDYMALPQEIDAWRRGMSTRAAVLQRIQAARVESLLRQQQASSQDLQKAREAADAAPESERAEAERRADLAASELERIADELTVARYELQRLQDETRGPTVRARQRQRAIERNAERRAAGG